MTPTQIFIAALENLLNARPRYSPARERLLLPRIKQTIVSTTGGIASPLRGGTKIQGQRPQNFWVGVSCL